MRRNRKVYGQGVDRRRYEKGSFYRTAAPPRKNEKLSYRLKRAVINKLTPRFIHRSRKVKYLFKGPKKVRRYSYRWNRRGLIKKRGC